MNTQQNSPKTKRLHLIYSFFTLIPIILLIRLFQLQIVNREEFRELCEKNNVKTHILPPPRGNFLDCNGRLLATNHPLFDLYWIGSSQKGLSLKQDHLLQTLTPYINCDPFVPDTYERIKKAEKFGRKTLLKASLSYDDACKISELCGEDKSLLLESHQQRTYPYGSLASHILGYLGKEENYLTNGKSGLERLLQDDLKGECGYAKHVTNSTGKQLSLKELKVAVPGNDIVLTLDLSLQQIAESLFTPEQAGAFVVMDPQTGGIKALVSYPNFDPTIFLTPLSQQIWEEKMQEDKPFLNRALTSAYPPASIFKLVTFAAGLEERIISEESNFRCFGSVTLGTRPFYCKRRIGHGTVSAKMALAYSCNVACYEIAQRLSIDQLANYAKRFGLGSKTDIMLAEHAGFVPSSQWKRSHLGQPWWKGETLCSAIGQSYFLVTPIQMVRMIASIFTGYLVKPRLLESDEIITEKLNLKPSTLSFLRESMKEVVQQGTGTRFRYLRNFLVYAKTGTAQTASLEKGSEVKKYKEHAWLATHFTYKNHEPLVLVAMIENVGSSGPAQDIVKKFLLEYQKLHSK